MGSRSEKIVGNRLPGFFGSYKAESLGELMFEVFIEPSYFPMLLTSQPCVLIGGRGTGKTTALRGLSYEGQFKFAGGKKSVIDTWRYFGVYHRLNTSRVTAFRGEELPEEKWIRLFSHYVNLFLCKSLCDFLGWYAATTGREIHFSVDAQQEITASLNIEAEAEGMKLDRRIRLALIRFEAFINNVADADGLPKLSMPGAPIDLMVQHLQTMDEFRGRVFFFLLDEYENLEDYQQRILNTYIKHSGEGYSFKIGVRELGLRQRSTLRAEEQLIDPADYNRVDIVQRLAPRFSDFAASVIEQRMEQESTKEMPDPLAVRELFRGLSLHEEAEKLGISSELSVIHKDVEQNVSREQGKWFFELSDLEQYVLSLWARGGGLAIANAIEDARQNERKWTERFSNYSYASLFTIRRGKRGIQKYYSGWKALVLLAAGNIRYLLQLVTESLALHAEEGQSVSQPVSPENQTKAAQETGKKNLQELEGLSVHGARLTKLVLAFGRIFQVMSAHVEGHTPEVNQFHLKHDNLEDCREDLAGDVEEILAAAVMHLALLRYPGSKLQDRHETREYDYAVHPIFAPYFVFSHRRKRKIRVASSEILGMIDQPAKTIDQILKRQGRPLDTDLPDQLELFEEFYDVTD